VQKSLLPATLAVVVLFALPGVAHAAWADFFDCALRKLLDLVDYGSILLICEIIAEGGMRLLIRRLGEEAVERALYKILKALGRRIVPFIGVALLAWWLFELLWECIMLI
jgi:hypothetical protein